MTREERRLSREEWIELARTAMEKRMAREAERDAAQERADLAQQKLDAWTGRAMLFVAVMMALYVALSVVLFAMRLACNG